VSRSSNISRQIYQFAFGFPAPDSADSSPTHAYRQLLAETAALDEMGNQSFLFKWEHPASEVHVTGTFDDWSKSVQLEKKGSSWEKLVNLPKAEKVYYKVSLIGVTLFNIRRSEAYTKYSYYISFNGLVFEESFFFPMTVLKPEQERIA
jgi:hypothetical protein